MASTYSPSLRIELIGTGEQSGTWGDTTNNNLGDLIEQAITGVEAIPMLDANYTLSSLNGSVDEARNAVIEMTSAVSLTASRNVVIPNVEKLYVFKNSTLGSQNIVITTGSGTTYTVPNGATVSIYCDGTNCYQATTYLNSPTLATPTITGNASVSGNLFVNGTLTTGAGPYTVLNSNNYTTYAPSLTGTGASGTWNIGISGNAATATSATSATNATNLTGSGTISSTTTATTQSAGTNNTTVATTAFVTTAVSAGAYAGPGAQVFTSNGTFTIPSGITKVKVTATGAGGNGTYSGGGGAGGTAIKWLSGLTPGNTLSVTTGSLGGDSVVASGTQTISTITGNAGENANGQTGGAGGVASGGDLNLAGQGGGGASGVTGDSGTRMGGIGGTSYWGGGARGSGNAANGANGGNYGGGGSGYGLAASSGGTGSAGVVVFEW